MKNCNITNKKLNIQQVYRKLNGDIAVKYYCYSEGSARSRNQKKLTHPECKSITTIYKNGEGYNLNFKIQNETRYPNLITCWCKTNNVKGTENNFPHDEQKHKNKQKMSISELI
jgi:hypothetical protein